MNALFVFILWTVVYEQINTQNSTCISDTDCGRFEDCKHNETSSMCTCRIYHDRVGNGCVLGKGYLYIFGRYICKQDYYKDEFGYCNEFPVVLGDSCLTTTFCTSRISNANCINKTCACPTNYQPYNSRRCDKIKQIGEECNDMRECVRKPGMDNLVVCSNNVCTDVLGTDSTTDYAQLNGNLSYSISADIKINPGYIIMSILILPLLLLK